MKTDMPSNNLLKSWDVQRSWLSDLCEKDIATLSDIVEQTMLIHVDRHLYRKVDVVTDFYEQVGKQDNTQI